MPTPRDTAAARRRYTKARRAEIQFAAALRKVAKNCGKLARKTFSGKKPIGSTAKLRRELENYGQALIPWAKATAERMVLDVARRDESFWADQSRELSRNLRSEIRNTPIGLALRERSTEAAAYITSLPLEAAQRVEKYAIEYMTQGVRASELAKRVMATGEVTQSRAMLIARTETSRTAGLLLEVRAKSVDSTHYRWVTAQDIDVRDRHRRLNGKVFRWDAPPIAGEKGERYNPGNGPNCRCYAEVILPGESRRNRSRFVAEAA